MKKFNYLLLGLAGLTLASCSNDDIVAPGTGDGNFAITVKLPAEMGTRTWENQGEGYYGQGFQALDLWYAVYEVDAEGNRISTVPVTIGEANFPTDVLYTTVGFNLANSKYYSIAFFALSEDAANVYSWDTEAGTISVNYENMTSDNNNIDAYDCFYNLHSTGKIGDSNTSLNQTVILNRPVAQINWGTADYDEDAVTDPNAFGDTPISQLKSTFTTQAYNTFDMFTKDVTGNMVPVTLEGFAVPTQGKFPVFEPVKDSETGEPTLENLYQYVAMQYVLAPAASSVMNLNLNIQNESATYNDDVAVNNAPVQANYRTNIFGNLLTDNLNITVVKDPIWGNPDYDLSMDVIEFLEAVKNGGTVTLTKDLTLPVEIAVKKDVIINLNGHSLTFDAPASQETLFYVTSGASLTVNGNGNINVPDGLMGVWVNNVNSVVNINGGNWTCGYPVNNQKGKVYVTGGTLNGTTEYDGHTWTLNCVDKNYPNEANIYVTGGSFINFNPADNACEGAGTSFVEEGYEVVETEKDGQKVYTVVPQGTVVTDNATEASEAAKNGGDVLLNGSISKPELTGSVYGQNWAAIVQNGGTIDGNGNTLNVGTFSGSNGKETYGIYTSGGTIKNLTITNAFRGIYAADKMTEDLIIDNCVLKTAYTINTAGSNYAPYTMTVNNTSLYGWTTWAAFSSATFNFCTFYPSVNWNVPEYNLCRPYIPTTFNNCDFPANWYLSLEFLKDGAMATFNNCTVNGVQLTAANAERLFAKIYLAAGVTLDQVAIFN